MLRSYPKPYLIIKECARRQSSRLFSTEDNKLCYSDTLISEKKNNFTLLLWSPTPHLILSNIVCIKPRFNLLIIGVYLVFV